MIGKLILQVLAGILGLFLALKFVPGANLLGTYRIIIIAGAVLGLVNFFVKPLLDAISFPLRILTLGLFSVLINMLIVWLVADVLFPKDIEIEGIIPLFWTTLIVWALNSLFLFQNSRKK